MKEFWIYQMEYTHKVIVQIVEQLSRQRCIQNTVKHLRWSVCKRQRGGGGASIRVLHNQGLCFQNQDTFFDFLKEQGRPPLSSLVQHIKCGWISINIPDYPKTSLRLFEQTVLIMPGLLIILHVQQDFEDTSGFKLPRILMWKTVMWKTVIR